MKKYILLASCVSFVSACSTTSPMESRIEMMQAAPSNVYCIVSPDESEDLVITNKMALDFYNESKSLPSCELLYQARYDFNAPTAKERVMTLSMQVEKLKREYQALKEKREQEEGTLEK